MSTEFPRLIIVDDSDSRIHYNGPWFSVIGSQDSVGDQGPPFRSTLHSTVEASASLGFAYNGGSIEVYGSSNGIFNNSGVIWACFIDGIMITNFPLPVMGGNNWNFCGANTVSDGLHTLTVNVTVPFPGTSNRTIWFDDIRYVPSASTPLDQEAIFVSLGDPQLQFGQGWHSGMTNTTGSIFTFDFIGISISWYGSIVQGTGNPWSATYSIDGQTPIHFVPNATIGNNQKFFETAQLPVGPHTLKVVYQGNNTTPLRLDYLAVQNGTLPFTTTSVSSHATTTSTGNGVSAGKSPTPVAAIAGLSVIGGLALIVLGLLLLRRHKRRAAQEKVVSSTPRPFDTTIHPSNTTPNHSLSLQQSTLAVRKPLLAPLPVSRPSPSPLLSRAERKAQAQAQVQAQAASGSRRRSNALPAMVSMQSNATRPPNVVVHEDSGIRMPPSTPTTNEIMEVPPLYTVE